MAVRPIPKDTNRKILESWLGQEIHSCAYEINGDKVIITGESIPELRNSVQHYEKMWLTEYPENMVLFQIYKKEEMIADWFSEFNIIYDKNLILNTYIISTLVEEFIQKNPKRSIEIIRKHTNTESVSRVEFINYHYVSQNEIISFAMNITSACLGITFDKYEEQVEFVLTWGDARYDT